MSSHFPGYPPASAPPDAAPFGGGRHLKASHAAWRQWLVPVALLFATALSTTFAGLFYVLGDVGFFAAVGATLLKPGLILQGLPFSIPLIIILLAHEMGHFLACRHHGVRCTPPYFIPAPISIAGTLGAFIKIKSHFHNRRVLFDIGVAGPLAGFVFVIPALWIGISFSRLIPKGSIAGGLSFGEPLVFRLFGRLALGYIPAVHDMVAHPIAMAAWFGLLATSLNLLPIWQLDGGHIAYAVFGRDLQKKISVTAAAALTAVSFLGWPTPSYLLFALLLVVLGMRARFYHPATLMDEEKLGPGRVFLALVAGLILILSFIVVPISIV